MAQHHPHLSGPYRNVIRKGGGLTRTEGQYRPTESKLNTFSCTIWSYKIPIYTPNPEEGSNICTFSGTLGGGGLLKTEKELFKGNLNIILGTS